MAIHLVRCPVSGAAVTRVSDLEGRTTQLIGAESVVRRVMFAGRNAEITPLLGEHARAGQRFAIGAFTVF